MRTPEETFGWIILIAFIGLVFYLRRKPRMLLTAHGTAMFATRAMLKKAGMLNASTGPILGYTLEPQEGLFKKREKKPPLVRLPSAVHVNYFAPTGLGKGVSCVVPWLLTVDESCVCVDFKGENALLTLGVRQAMGHQVAVLDPFGVVTGGGPNKLARPSDTLNILDFIDPQNPLSLDEIGSAAEAIVVREGSGVKNSEHWNAKAEDRIKGYTAVTAAYGRKELGTRSLQTVMDFISNPAKAKQAQELMKQSPHWGGMLARLGHAIGQTTGEEESSIGSSTLRHLRFLNTVPIANNMKSSSFNPALLKRGKLSLFLVIPPDFMRPSAGVLRLWLDACMKAVIRQGLDESRRVHFWIDEASSVLSGGMKSIESALDVNRGYGIRLHLVWQSLGQTKVAFPADGGQTCMSNTTQVLFGANEFESATYISKRCGNFTNIVESGGSNDGGGRSAPTGAGGGGSTSTSWGTNSGWQQQGRELLKPEEVLALPPPGDHVRGWHVPDSHLALTLVRGKGHEKTC